MDNYELQEHYTRVLESGADIIFGPICLCDINRYVKSRHGWQVHCTRPILGKEFSQIYERIDVAVREFFKLKEKLKR